MDIAQNAIKASCLDTIEGKVIIFLNTGVWDDFDRMIAGVSVAYAKLWKL